MVFHFVLANVWLLIRNRTFEQMTAAHDDLLVGHVGCLRLKVYMVKTICGEYRKSPGTPLNSLAVGQARTQLCGLWDAYGLIPHLWRQN